MVMLFMEAEGLWSGRRLGRGLKGRVSLVLNKFNGKISLDITNRQIFFFWFGFLLLCN